MFLVKYAAGPKEYTVFCCYFLFLFFEIGKTRLKNGGRKVGKKSGKGRVIDGIRGRMDRIEGYEKRKGGK